MPTGAINTKTSPPKTGKPPKSNNPSGKQPEPSKFQKMLEADKELRRQQRSSSIFTRLKSRLTKGTETFEAFFNKQFKLKQAEATKEGRTLTMKQYKEAHLDSVIEKYKDNTGAELNKWIFPTMGLISPIMSIVSREVGVCAGVISGILNFGMDLGGQTIIQSGLDKACNHLPTKYSKILSNPTVRTILAQVVWMFGSQVTNIFGNSTGEYIGDYLTSLWSGKPSMAAYPQQGLAFAR